MKKFEHGGDIKSFAKELKCPANEIIDLSSNINVIQPNCKVDFNTLSISAYPNYEKLYKKIAKHYGVNKNQLELFNGGSSAIFTLFRHLGLKHCTIYSPAYLEYKKASVIYNYKLNLINRFQSKSSKIKKNSLVIFVNPSTPDGQYYDIKKLLKLWKKKNCTVLIDESFLEFINKGSKASAVEFTKEYDKLYILKSMTKFYSSAGIRIGTLLSNKNNIEKLKAKEPMWKLSQFDMNYILSVIKDKAFVKKTIQTTKKNRQQLNSALKKYTFIKKVYKSSANYLLVELQDIDANALQEDLKTFKIMIRSCENFDFLNKYHVRIAIKDKQSIKTLCDALDTIIIKKD